MILLNDRMKHLAREELRRLDRQPELPPELHQILMDGFREKNGCYFFRRLSEELNDITPAVIKSRYWDRTGYEVFVNTIHIDNYVDKFTLSLGILFSREFVRRWSRWSSEPCKLVLCSHGEGEPEDTSFRFYVPRSGEIYMDYSDLESFSAGILAIDVHPGLDLNMFGLSEIVDMGISG